MAKKNRLIPFRWMPGSYGLVGDSYKRAEAAYYYEGEELERRLAALDKLDDVAFDCAMIDIDLAYGRIDAYEHAKRRAMAPEGVLDDRTALEIDYRFERIDEYHYRHEIAALDHAGDEIGAEIAEIELDVEFGKLHPKEAEKRIATLKGEPWVGLLDDGFNAADGISGFYFEFDWNDAWISELQRNGYIGMTDDDIMQQWFGDVCRTEAAEIIPQVVPFNSGRVIHRRQTGGTTEYS